MHACQTILQPSTDRSKDIICVPVNNNLINGSDKRQQIMRTTSLIACLCFSLRGSQGFVHLRRSSNALQECCDRDRLPCSTRQQFHPRCSLKQFTKKKKSSDVNTRERKEPSYSTVDDGSPLGVGVVFIGSLVALNAPERIDPQDQESLIWLVFVTASTVAGIARLIRYYGDRKET